MKSLISIPAFLLILANVAVHALGGWSPVPGIDFSPLIRMGIHHYLQMAVLLLLLLLARGGRDRFYPGLVALTALLGGIWLSGVRPERPAVDLLALPLSWMLCALCAASAASGAVPPPEERPGLVGFKKAVVFLNVLNFGLLFLFWEYGSGYRDFYWPVLQATAVCAVFSLWLLTAAGRWANLSFIAGLAGVVPLLTVALVLTGRIGQPLETLPRFYSYCLHFQMALLAMLSGLVCLISLAVKAGVRLAGRTRKPVRSRARALFLFPAGAVVMAAVLLPAGHYGRREMPDDLYQGETQKFSVADLEFLAPTGYAPGQIRIRLRPVHPGQDDWAASNQSSQADWLIMAERRWASDEEARQTLEDLDRRLRSQPENAVLGGDQSWLFGRPAWLVITPTAVRRAEGRSAPPFEPAFDRAAGRAVPPPLTPTYNLELYIYQPGGALKLGGMSFSRSLLPDGGDPDLAALRRSVDQFLEAAANVLKDYRWLTPSDRDRPAAFRTVFGALDRLPKGLVLTAVVHEADPSDGERRLFSSEDDWNRPPDQTEPRPFFLPSGQSADQALLSAQNQADRGKTALGPPGDIPYTSLFLRWGYQTGPAWPDRRISAWPAVDRGLNFYRGYQFSRFRSGPESGLPGETDLRYFRRPPLSLAASANAGLRLTWTAADPDRPPLLIDFTASLRAGSPEARARKLAEALGRWQLMLGTLSRTDLPAAAPAESILDQPADGEDSDWTSALEPDSSTLTEPVPDEDAAAEPDSSMTEPAPREAAPEPEFSTMTEPGSDEVFFEPPEAAPLARPAPAPRPVPAPVQTPPADGFSAMTEPDELDAPEEPEEDGSVSETDRLPAEAVPASDGPPKIFNPVPAPTRAGSR